jgi:hypothetical protein
MKTGIEMIAQERLEQIEKHGRTVEGDVKFNGSAQLAFAASALCYPTAAVEAPCPWGWNPEIWKRIIEKPYKERLAVAGAFIAAEIDRIQEMEKKGE